MSSYPEEIGLANNLNELFDHLKSVDIYVPARTKGRSKDHTERYAICRLLSSLAATNYLLYGVSLKKSDRPDYLLQSDGKYIGIEHTESTSEDESSYAALIQSERPGHWIEPAHFIHGRKFTLNQKRELLQQNKLTSDGWIGDDCEKEWSLFVKESIIKKCKTFNKPDFKKHDENWLLIYSNPPCPFLQKELLVPYIEKLWESNSGDGFDKIFIETSWKEQDTGKYKPYIIALQNKKIEYLPVIDLWQ